MSLNYSNASEQELEKLATNPHAPAAWRVAAQRELSRRYDEQATLARQRDEHNRAVAKRAPYTPAGLR